MYGRHKQQWPTTVASRQRSRRRANLMLCVGQNACLSLVETPRTCVVVFWQCFHLCFAAGVILAVTESCLVKVRAPLGTVSRPFLDGSGFRIHLVSVLLQEMSCV